MWSLFGGGAAKKEAPKNAILALRGQLEMLQKREKHLESQIDEQDAIARKYVNTNKNAAKAALRRKKGHEKRLEQTSAQIVHLEGQVYSIEAANINNETLQTLKQAGAAMEHIHGGMNLDQVDQTMDILREQHQLAQEIGDAITNTSGFGPEIDEDELESELEQLEQEKLDDRMVNTGAVPIHSRLEEGLPAVGNSELRNASAEEDDEEAELAKLKAEMAF